MYQGGETIMALVKSTSEAAIQAEKAGQVLHRQGMRTGSAETPNSAHGTRSKAASASTLNLSTLQRSVSLTALSFTVKNDAGFL